MLVELAAMGMSLAIYFVANALNKYPFGGLKH